MVRKQAYKIHVMEYCPLNPEHGNARVTCEKCDFLVSGPKGLLNHWCSPLSKVKENAAMKQLSKMNIKFTPQNAFVCESADDEDKMVTCFVDFELRRSDNLKIPADVRCVLELDEHQHAAYDTFTDSSRPRRIYESLDGNEKLLFVRVNADAYTVDGKKGKRTELSIEDRITTAINWLRGSPWKVLDEAEDGEESGYGVAYFYYSTVQNGTKPSVSLKKDFDEEITPRIIKVFSPPHGQVML
jgi:hypothetical protein